MPPPVLVLVWAFTVCVDAAEEVDELTAAGAGVVIKPCRVHAGEADVAEGAFVGMVCRSGRVA